MPPFIKQIGTVDPPGLPHEPQSEVGVTRQPAGVRYTLLSALGLRPGRKFHVATAKAKVKGVRTAYPDLKAFEEAQNDQGCVGSVGAKIVEAQFQRAGVNVGELDPEFLWRVARERDDLGENERTGLYQALTVAVDYGVPPLGAYTDIVKDPRTAKELRGSTTPDKEFVDTQLPPLVAAADLARIQSVVSFGPDLESWKSHLVDKGPLAVQLNVVPETFRSLESKRARDASAALPWLKMDANLRLGDYDSHAVVVVEYVEQGSDKKSYFVLLNSFGRKWGNNGFARISVADAAQFFTRAFGVELLDRPASAA